MFYAAVHNIGGFAPHSSSTLCKPALIAPHGLLEDGGVRARVGARLADVKSMLNNGALEVRLRC